MSALPTELVPRVRSMIEDDLVGVLCIEQMVYNFPWTLGIFRDCLRIGYVCQVYENESGILGYGVMSVAAGECHILNICVHPDYQRRGLGQAMVEHLLDIAVRNKARMAFLDVRISNETARHLYQVLGFNEIGERNDYYPAPGGGRENALVLAKTLI